MDIEYLEDKSKRVWKSGTFIYPIPAALVSSCIQKSSFLRANCRALQD